MAAAHDFAASVAAAVFTFVNAAGHSAAAFDAASVGRYSDDFGSVHWKHRAWDLSRGELRLGRSHLDQKSSRFCNCFGSHIARLQTMPHLFTGDDLTKFRATHKYADFSIDHLCNLWMVSCIISRDTPSVDFIFPRLLRTRNAV